MGNPIMSGAIGIIERRKQMKPFAALFFLIFAIFLLVYSLILSFQHHWAEAAFYLILAKINIDASDDFARGV
jgi:hypothetical protein